MSEFKIQTYGKWIFSGEHTVLRGGPALVFPLFKKKLELEYWATPGHQGLNVQAAGENANDILELFPGVLAKALELIRKTDKKISGIIKFTNELPLGSGLGASSSLCVAFSRWFHFLGFLNEIEIYEFARQLENIFHGESSGVDIAVVIHEKPLIFKRPDIIETLNVKNFYKLYLSHTGQKGITKDCVAKVSAFIKADPTNGLRMDQKMINATNEAVEVFRRGDSSQAESLIPIINSAYECFKEWGLTTGQVDSHIDYLKSKGALAAKPTGSGGGGYVLSLWSEEVSKEFDFEMISLFK